MICAVCKATLPDDSRFCLSCGADMSDPSAERRPFDTVADVQQMLTGAVAGHYKIGRLLGRGGMGTVFLAEDLALQREVAIKVLPPRLTAEEKFVSRFLHEARTAAKLDHPNIIPIFAVQSSESLHYFAMKYVAGRTVDQILDGGPMPVDEVRRVLADAALALGHAHRRGVVHRDVKPSNIMVDDTGRVLLGDFGISKALESSTQFTGTGQIVGTPHYMSPEQARGGVKIDGRSDQYSLAVVGFQMLTGHLLFESSQAHSIIYGHIHEQPRSSKSLRPEVPDYLAQALLKALEKDPDQRYPTMEEFAAAVCPERGPAVISGASRSGPRATTGSSRRAMIGVAATVVLLVIAGAVYRFMPHGPTPGTTPPQPPVTTEQPVDSGKQVVDHPGTRGGGKAPAPAPGPTRTPPTPISDPVRPAAPAQASKGYLSVDADTYGTVSIDGVDVGDTPVLNRALAPGTYTVRVTRDGFRPWSDRVTITAGNTERRRAVLVPQ